MPYKGEQKIVFPSEGQQNVMLVFGDNMRGKTSLLNAIRWAFFGRALGRHLKIIAPIDIVNIDATKQNDWNVAVNIRFENDGHEYDLRRNMQPKPMIYKPRTSNDFSFDVMLRKDSNVLRGDQIPYELNQIIPEDIARFFLFDGELLQEYEMLLDDQDEQGKSIKDAIEKVLGVPALLNARNELGTLLKDALKKQTSDTQHIEGVRRQSEERGKLESLREDLDADLRKLQEEFDSCQNQVEMLDRELEESKTIQAEKTKLDNYQQDLDQVSKRQENLQQNKLLLLKDAWKDLVQPKLQFFLIDLERKRNSYQDEQRKKNFIESRIESLESILKESQCPTCEQHISSEKKNSVGSELGSLQASLKKYEDDVNKLGNLSEQITKLSRIKPSGAGDNILNIDTELRKNSLEITRIDNEIEELNEKLKNHNTAEISRKWKLRDDLLKLVGTVERDIRDQRIAIDENERKQALLTKQIESNADARAQKSSKLVSAYTQLKNIFSESINALRDDLRQNVADLATQAFTELTTEPTYKGLQINESYGLTIVDRENREIAQRSAGAEQIVALALIDGLNRTARKTGPIIMDTPLGRLDLKHRDNVLKYLPKMAEQVILLVHEGEIRKDEIIDSLRMRIGCVYNIERISSSESRIVKE